MIRPTRRELLGLLGGGAVGVALSPLPWKLLDDAAIWTQNWSLTPGLPRGPLSAARGHCGLCPAACGIEVRCVGGSPFGARPAPGHPSSHGALCPLGLAGHQLRLHRDRLAQPLLAPAGGAPTPVSPAEVAGLVARELEAALGAGGAGSVALLDTRPGRSVSLLYRAWLASLGPEARYLPAGGERGPFDRFARAVGGGDPDLERSLVPDLFRARTIVGFGAPFLEGYGSQGWFARTLRTPSTVRPALLQIDSRPSRTALLSDRWLRIRPGTEGAAALGIGRAVLDNHPAAAAGPPGIIEAYRALTVEQAAGIAGVDPADLVFVARKIVEHGPAVVLPGVDPAAGPLPEAAETAILGLAALTGGLGVEGGLVFRPAPPLPEGLADRDFAPRSELDRIPDGSLRLLLVDASTGSGLRETALAARKLHHAEGRLVLLAPFAPAPLPAGWLAVPTPVWLEAREEAETPLDATAARLALTASAGPRRAGTIAPIDLVLSLDRSRGGTLLGGDEGNADGFSRLLLARARSIHESGRGNVAGPGAGAPRPVAGLDGPEELVRELEAGALWIDDPPACNGPLAPHLDARAVAAIGEARQGRPAADAGGLTLVPHGDRMISDRLALPLHLTKLCRENGVVPDVDTATLHPSTARRLGLVPGARAVLLSGGDRRQVRIALDARVPSDTVDLALAPAPGAFGDTPRGPADAPFEARTLAATLEVA
jgi:hypothetical protein